jgi:hypothetical protein
VQSLLVGAHFSSALPHPYFAYAMDWAFFLLLSHLMRNGFTVDDLGLLLAMIAVIVLITGVIYRAAVGLLPSSWVTRPLT